MSPQQKIHWEKLQLLGMCAQMRGPLAYIHKKIPGSAAIDISYSICHLQDQIKIAYEAAMRMKKIVAEMKKKKTKCT